MLCPKKIKIVFFVIPVLLSACGNPLGQKSTANLGSGNSGPNSSVQFSGLESITSLGGGSVRLNWTSAAQASYYSVYEMTNTPSLVALIAAPSSNHVIAGLSPLTTYKYRVRAADANGIVENNDVMVSVTMAAISAITVTSISPSGDDLVGGSTIQISGSGFQAGALAYVNDVSCTSSTLVSSSQMNCSVPASAVAPNTFVAVKVVNPDTGVSSLVSPFKYIRAVNCLDWKNINYGANGDYSIDHDNNTATPRLSVSCDQNTDGGGWMQVLNYLHQAGTNPGTTTLTSSFPRSASSVLGVDESASSANWGHLDGVFLASLGFSEMRFMCKTSGHARIVDFKTSQAACLSYLKTGVGSCSSLGSSFSALTLQTSIHIPMAVDGTVSSGASTTLTNFPFYRGGQGHWGIRGLGSRWECDDFPGNFSLDTLHRVWIR